MVSASPFLPVQLSLIRINSCELYHELVEKNMRDYAGEGGTSVTVLGR